MDIAKNFEHSSNIFDLNDLPEEILFEFFVRLNFEDLCKCYQVCRRWYTVAQSPSLKKRIIVTKFLKPWQFSRLVQFHFHKRLEEFQFLNENSVPRLVHIKKKAFFRLRAMCPELKKLILIFCSLTHVTLADMPACLRYLSIRKSEINPYHFFGTCPQQYAPHLTCLDVGGVSTFLTSEDLHIFTHLKSLRCLYLEGCFRINNGGIESMIDLINHLEVLDVEGTDISNEGAIIIITNGQMLKKLYLGYINVDDDVFDDMYMDMFLRLQTLCIRFTNVSSVTVKKFFNYDRKKVDLLSNCDARGVFSDIEKSLLDRFRGCNHYLSHTCSY